MSFFSVVIPIYNAENTLLECLKSVRDQTFKDFEVVLVNDGSIDFSIEIIQNWLVQNPDQKHILIEQSNAGLGASRNVAITQSSSQYICFLDADDYWKSDKLESLHSCIQQNSPSLLYHPVISFGLGSERERYSYPLKSMEDLMIKGNPIIPSAVCIKADVARENLFSIDSKYHGAEDLLLWGDLLNKGLKFYFLNTPLTYYRETGGMSTNLKNHFKKVFNVFDRFKEQGFINLKLHQLAVRRKQYEAARFYQKRKHFVKAETHYKCSKKMGPKVWFLRLVNFFGVSI